MGDRSFVMVSEWMNGGNINEFIKAHRNVNRFELVSCPQCWLRLCSSPFQQLKDVTSGLVYMHDQAMVHGDLKGVLL